MRQIQVIYDGKYPCACYGTLTVIVDGETVYTNKYCCHSTGACYWAEARTVEGSLIWDDAGKFDKDIQDAVEQELSKVRVCCGGCI